MVKENGGHVTETEKAPNGFLNYPLDPIESIKKAEKRREEEKRNMKSGDHTQIKEYATIQLTSVLNKKFGKGKDNVKKQAELLMDQWKHLEYEPHLLNLTFRPTKASKMEEVPK